MASALNWQTVQVAAGSPVRISVTGNVDTRVVTRYFWHPVSDDVSQSTWDRDDGEELNFDVALIKPGQRNRLGFTCCAGPVVPTETSLYITFQLQQGSSILLQRGYALSVSDPNTPVLLSDGITLSV